MTARAVAMSARIGRAATFAGEGDHVRAAEAAEDLARRPNPSSVDVYDVACVYARSAAAAGRDPRLSSADRTRLQAQYADRAIALLRDAVARGYRHPVAMKTDHDLDSLRARDDYRKLIADLEAR
jgi:hypothetical protein